MEIGFVSVVVKLASMAQNGEGHAKLGNRVDFVEVPGMWTQMNGARSTANQALSSVAPRKIGDALEGGLFFRIHGTVAEHEFNIFPRLGFFRGFAEEVGGVVGDEKGDFVVGVLVALAA